MTKRAPDIYPANEMKRKVDRILQSPYLMREASHYLVLVEEASPRLKGTCLTICTP